MDSAMRSGEIQPAGDPRCRVRGSERTAARGSRAPAVALLSGARQRRLGLGVKGAGKVGAEAFPCGDVSALLQTQPGVSHDSGPTEAIIVGHASCG